MKTMTTLKKIKMVSILVCFCLSAASYAQVVTYPQLTSIQGCQYDYTLKVREQGASTWQTVPLYNIAVTQQSGSAINSTIGNFSCDGMTEIQITFSSTVTSAAVRPASLNITPAISDSTITFTIAGPEKFYVDINDDHYANCIHVLAQPLEADPPQQGDPNVIFIPAGTLETNTIDLQSNQTLYIEGGAAVAGVNLDSTSNTRVLGRGFIYRASFDAISARNASNATIDGVLDLNHGWGGNGGDGFRCAQSTDMIIKNTASFSSKRWGDAYNIYSSENVVIDDVFIRTNDDAITFYGGGKSGYSGDCKNITVTNSVLLPDLAQSFHVGVYGDQYETEIRDVTCSNIDIDDWSRTPGRPVIYFTVGDKVRAANFHFNDIRVTGYMPASFDKALIGMVIVNNGSYNYNPGREIDSVYYTNVSYTGSNGTPHSAINGYDAGRLVKNVFFEDLVINGTDVTTASEGNFTIGAYTENISLVPAGTGDFDPGLYYKLKNRTSGMVLDGGGETENGAPVKQWSDVSSPNLEWQVIDIGNGYYKLKNRTSGLVLDGGGETENGAPVKQWSDVSSPNLEWQVTDIGNGYYKIKNHTSGLVLDGGGETENGALVKQWSDVSSTNLEWQIISVEAASSRLASENEEISTQQDTRIEVYPNPVSDVFYIRNANVGDTVLVYDNFGKLIVKDNITQGEGDKQIGMGGFRPGLYFIKIKGNETEATVKVIKK